MAYILSVLLIVGEFCVSVNRGCVCDVHGAMFMFPGGHADIDSRGSTPVQDNGKYSSEAEPPTPMSTPSAISVVSRTVDNRYDWNSHPRRNTPPPPRPRCKDYDGKNLMAL